MIQIIADEKALTPERIQKWFNVTDNLPFFCQDQKRQEPNNPQPFCNGRVSGFLVIKNDQICIDLFRQCNGLTLTGIQDGTKPCHNVAISHLMCLNPWRIPNLIRPRLSLSLHNHLCIDCPGDHDPCSYPHQDVELPNPGKRDKGAGVAHHVQGVLPSSPLISRKVSRSLS